MMLIADSGSTKTDWQLINEEGPVKRISTLGFNPYFQGKDEIALEIKEKLLPAFHTLHAMASFPIFYYGAGCSTPEKKQLIADAIRQSFPYAFIEVEHDLIAAARALCGTNEGIAAILGTGSNSCYYDGREIKENTPSLGFILGDEGSGAFIGKKLITDYLYNEMPVELAIEMDDFFKLSKDDILTSLYKKPMPSRFLASFNPFILQYLNGKSSSRRGVEYLNTLLDHAFGEFLDRHICKYAKHLEVPLHIVGSIGFHYSAFVQKAAKKRKIKIGTVLQNPMDGLINFHFKKK